jgi:capsular polysaccharide biosynthesis protein
MSPRRRPARKRASPPSPSRAAWMTARARNALRRPVFIGAISVVTFIASLVALVVVPQQAKRAANAIRPAAAARPDTMPTVSSLRAAERQVVAAESSLAGARTALTRLIAVAAEAAAADTTATGEPVSSAARNRRDTLTAQIEQLDRLMARAENAPLLGSYRALAEAPPMQGDAQVKVLLDSLVELERERESFNAVGGVDPVFVALSARANELGRNIQALVVGRRAAMQQELATLGPGPNVVSAAIASRPLPDTIAAMARLDTARTVAAEVANRLARERTDLLRLDVREARARELANVGASPMAMLTAALVFGAMIGFGVALFDEVRRPRIADPYEIERATGVRVLGVIKPLPPSPDRGRRAADRNGPPYLDPGADGHQLIYLTVATAGTDVVMLTVTGDNPAVSAIVAINFAAIAAQEARATLLVDTDAADTVETALRLPASPGVMGLVEGKVSWPEAIRPARTGRDRTIDVVSSGHGTLPIEELKALFQRDIARLSRRYDAMVLVSSPDQVSAGLPTALPIPDVLYCARTGQTPVAELKKSLEDLEASGCRVRGVVLWDAPDPALLEEQKPAAPQRQPRREPAGVA